MLFCLIGGLAILYLLYNNNVFTGGVDEPIEQSLMIEETPVMVPQMAETTTTLPEMTQQPATMADNVEGATNDTMFAEFNHQDMLIDPQNAVNNLSTNNKLDPQDLLPSYNNLKSDLIDDINIDKLNDNYLTAKPETIIGVNTVGSSLRNANYGLRSEPPNPQTMVSPWNASTINPDLQRLPLEIGCE